MKVLITWGILLAICVIAARSAPNQKLLIEIRKIDSNEQTETAPSDPANSDKNSSTPKGYRQLRPRFGVGIGHGLGSAGHAVGEAAGGVVGGVVGAGLGLVSGAAQGISDGLFGGLGGRYYDRPAFDHTNYYIDEHGRRRLRKDDGNKININIDNSDRGRGKQQGGHLRGQDGGKNGQNTDNLNGKGREHHHLVDVVDRRKPKVTRETFYIDDSADIDKIPGGAPPFDWRSGKGE